MIDVTEIKSRHWRAPASGALARLALVAVAALAAAAFGLGPPVSSASAKDGQSVTPKVIGGSVAPNGSWPSQAFVQIEPEPDSYYSCGGTLIDPYWVLTAAHCVVYGGEPAPEGAILTAIGINDLNDVGASDVIGIRSVHVHPSYQSLRSGDRWDFALLELASPSGQPTTPLIEPGQEAFTAGGAPGKVAGWGCTSQSAGNCVAPYPNDLLEANVDFVSDALCGSGASYGGSFDPAIMVCAGNFVTGTPDTCYGDSGGPLIAFGPGGERLLAGVTSFGNECALPAYPGVYARVLAGRPWILTTIEENLRLEVTRSGTGSGTVTSNPAGISCGTSCSADFTYGTEVTLTAKAASGSGFTGWSGACSGTGSCEVTIQEPSAVTANFKKGPTVSLKAKPVKRTHKRKATFRFKASQSGSTLKCRLDGKAWRKCKSPKTYKNLKRGRNHTFRVKATKSGITGPVRKYTWTIRK